MTESSTRGSFRSRGYNFAPGRPLNNVPAAIPFYREGSKTDASLYISATVETESIDYDDYRKFHLRYNNDVTVLRFSRFFDVYSINCDSFLNSYGIIAASS